jgi:hypothetical protein
VTDDEFIAAFEAADISREDWTHEAHVRMGWIYVTQGPNLASATDKARAGIGKLNAVNDVPPELYHETVTCAFMALIAARVKAASPATTCAMTWEAFRVAHPELLSQDDPVLLKHYDKVTLESDAARIGFVEPDRAFE